MKVSILKQKDFSLLMLGKLVSLMGTQMQNFALSLYVLKITGSATKFASVLAVTLIPQLILGPIAGVFTDWLDRKKIIIVLDMLSGILVGIYAIIFAINGCLSLNQVYILAISLSIISLVFNPAISTVIPSITKKEELVDANGINSFIMNLGNLAAPALAGVLFGFYDMFLILAINSISFILSFICEIFVDIPKTNKKPEKINAKSFINDFGEGIKFIKNKKIMLSVITLGLIINFTFTPIFSVGLTYISKQILKITDYQYGILETVLVIPMLMAPFICSSISKKIKFSRILFLDIFFTSILIGIMAIIPSTIYLNFFNSNFIPYISLITVTFIISLMISIGNMALGIMFQQEVPLEMMGRVGSVMGSVCMAAIPIGQIIFGLLFDKIEAWMCVSICSGILFITILAFKKALCGNTEDSNLSITNESLSLSSPEVVYAVDTNEH